MEIGIVILLWCFCCCARCCLSGGTYGHEWFIIFGFWVFRSKSSSSIQRVEWFHFTQGVLMFSYFFSLYFYDFVCFCSLLYLVSGAFSAVACRYGFYWFLVSLLMNTFWCYGIWILFAYWCNNHMCLPLWDEQSIDRNICLYVKPPPQQRYIIILLTFICACVCVKLSIDNLIE